MSILTTKWRIVKENGVFWIEFKMFPLGWTTQEVFCYKTLEEAMISLNSQLNNKGKEIVFEQSTVE